MAATDIDTLKTNIQNTISSAAASISGNQVRDILLDMVDSILISSNYGYSYDNTLTLTAGKFTLLSDLSTVTDSLLTCNYIAFNVKDSSTKDLSLYQNSNSIMITLNLPDGSSTSFESSFESIGSDVITFSISSRSSTGTSTISLNTALNFKIDSLDSNSVMTFEQGITKSGNVVRLGDINITDNIQLIATADGTTFYLNFPDEIILETLGSSISLLNPGIEIEGVVVVSDDLKISNLNWLVNSDTESVTPKFYVDKNIMNSGDTISRPASPSTNEVYRDTTLEKPIYYDGSAWRDFTGTLV